MSTEKSLELRRAEHSLQAVKALEGKQIGHYVSYVRALPANILQNGLGQALAMLLAAAKGKQDEPHKQLYNHMQSWLCGKHDDAPYPGEPKLIDAIAKGSEEQYLHAHAEALAYLNWLKKLTVAFLNDPEQQEAS